MGSNICYPQLKKYKVIDKFSNIGVAFASVGYGNAKGIYTDERGYFYINDTIENISVSHLSYFVNNFNLLEKDSILKLNPRVIELQEVVINSNIKANLTTTFFGTYYKKEKFKFFCFPKTEFITYMKPSKKVENFTVTQIYIPCSLDCIDKKRKKIKEIEKFVFRIKVYDSDRERLFSGILIVAKKEIEENEVIYNLEKGLLFPFEGLYIGVELIGWYNNENEFVDNSYSNKQDNCIRLKFSRTKEYNTYFINPFSPDNDWKEIKKYNKNFDLTLKKPLGLAIGLGLKEN